MLYIPNQGSSVVLSKMVTNAKLPKNVEEQEELYEKENREVKRMLAELANKLKKMKYVVYKKEMKEEEEEEEVLDDEEDEVSKTKRPFIKNSKALEGKSNELPMFMGRMDVESVLEWIEALENFFECEKTS